MPADVTIDLEGCHTILWVLEDAGRRAEIARERLAGRLVGCRRVTVAVIPAHPSPLMALVPVDLEAYRRQLVARAQRLARDLCSELASTVCATHLVLENPRWAALEQLARAHHDELVVLCLSGRARRRLRPPAPGASRRTDTGPDVRWIDPIALSRTPASTR